jgi:hypothetical protein
VEAVIWGMPAVNYHLMAKPDVSFCNVVVFANDVGILVGRMRDDIDLGIPDEKVRHDIAHRELYGGQQSRSGSRYRKPHSIRKETNHVLQDLDLANPQSPRRLR